MKLDLLYEVDAPKPWGKPHPWGQRERERRAYYDAIEQIQLADRLGFNTIWAVDQLICYVQFGYHAHETVMRTIEILGKEVLPEIEKYRPAPPKNSAVSGTERLAKLVD